MLIYLIRHGETLANEQKLYCGKTELSLSKKGISDVLYLKEQGIYPQKPGIFAVSGLLRTKETLSLIYDSVNIEILPELEEYNFGAFEMKSYEELKEDEEYLAWIKDETGNISCPGGESIREFETRVSIGFNKLRSFLESGVTESVFAVVHGGVIASVMEKLFPKRKNFYQWQPPPGTGYTLSFYKEDVIYKNIGGK